MKKIFIITFLFLFLFELSIFAIDSNANLDLYLSNSNSIESYDLLDSENLVENSTSQPQQSSTIVTENKKIQAEDFLTADNILIIILITVGIVIILLGIAILVKFK